MIAQPRTWAGRSHAQINAAKAEKEAAPEWSKEIFGTYVYGEDPENLETIKDIGAPVGEVCFEAEIVQPKSGRYRSVWVHVPPEQVLALLKLCRHAAAEQREKPMATEVCAPPFGDAQP
jgi:hypothetical protein